MRACDRDSDVRALEECARFFFCYAFLYTHTFSHTAVRFSPKLVHTLQDTVAYSCGGVCKKNTRNVHCKPFSTLKLRYLSTSEAHTPGHVLAHPPRPGTVSLRSLCHCETRAGPCYQPTPPLQSERVGEAVPSPRLEVRGGVLGVSGSG